MSGRSYLFVPGNRPDRFEKARSAGADAVIVDLEDAVPSEKKTETREAVSAWLSPESPAYVRVNGTAPPWFWDDLKAVTRPGLAGVVLPKAEDPDEISEVGPVRGRDDRPSRHRAREGNTRPGHPPGLTGTGPSPQGRSRPWLVGKRSRPAFAPTARYLRQRRLTCLRGDVGDSPPGGTIDVVPVDKIPQGSAPPKPRALEKP